MRKWFIENMNNDPTQPSHPSNLIHHYQATREGKVMLGGCVSDWCHGNLTHHARILRAQPQPRRLYIKSNHLFNLHAEVFLSTPPTPLLSHTQFPSLGHFCTTQFLNVTTIPFLHLFSLLYKKKHTHTHKRPNLCKM